MKVEYAKPNNVATGLPQPNDVQQDHRRKSFDELQVDD